MSVTDEDCLRTVVNLRDLGGLPIDGGGSTRSGVLLRSDAPYLGDESPAGFAWPPATVVDLRDKTETADASFPWPPEVHYISNPLFSGARIDRVLNKPLVTVYEEILRDAPHRIVGALNRFGESGATVVHCAAGKDRTGIVVAVALLLVGVQHEAIVADYQKTAHSIQRVHRRMGAHKRLPAAVGVDHQILRTPREAVELVIDRVSAARGGPWGWVEAHGADLVQLRRWAAGFSGD